MIFAYTLSDKHTVCITACYGDDSEVSIPPMLGQLPVDSLAPYAFSEGREPSSDCRFFTDAEDPAMQEAAWEAGPSKETNPGFLPPPLSARIAGDRLKRIVLPETVQRIGRYAFYNCSSLSSLSLASGTDLGAGLFAGCGSVSELSVLVDEHAKSSLQELLLSFHDALLLSYDVLTSGKRDCKYRLIFPQYYENADENTPARITVRDLHGSGLFYRNCFADTQFQIERYDRLFPHAQANEPEAVTAELALCRLLVPTGLSDEARGEYTAYLHAHIPALSALLSRYFLQARVSDRLLRAFLGSDFADAALLDQLIDETAGTLRTAPAFLSFLMDIRQKKSAFRQGGRRFAPL